jgi:CxxC-x17-CxxC domain-containing protein
MFEDEIEDVALVETRSPVKSRRYDVVCGQCGVDCQVPFKPTGTKPVLCDTCFKDSPAPLSGDGDLDSPRNRTSSKKRHRAICSVCRVKFDLPFKPINGKPVFCKACYGKSSNGSAGGSVGESRDLIARIDILDAKLDMILNLLGDRP